ncbi:hypothetical protein AMJ40_03150 [candidate division TA06 bacterium DG_26]|uniref:Lysine transporter LysE n=1 Tax=candidate division TA06 bacterium DG_26 TaxID=1703771 RepID=A0A0S7WJR1_UNCT6|nr:MAG: hypothetical protein AMJ40_03150 [candidate division TA06 bacterium DG_26]
MSVLGFLLQALIISLSGVMAPGPMTAVTISKGSQSPHAGALVAFGHGIIEFPLMIVIFHGFGHFVDLPYVKQGIGLGGGLFLLLMAIDMLRSINKPEMQAEGDAKSPVITGMLLSLGNPYFLVWWATVGAALILQATSFGILWFAIFALMHWSCDFAWCYFLSALSFRGKRFFGRMFQKALFLVCSMFLIFLSGKFILDALS